MQGEGQERARSCDKPGHQTRVVDNLKPSNMRARQISALSKIVPRQLTWPVDDN